MNKAKVILIFMVIILTLSGCVQSVTNITIEFDTNGGNEIESITYNGGSINIPDNPTKEGFIFDGWYWDNETFLNPFTANSIMDQPIEDRLTVYAKWISQDSELTLTLKSIYQLALDAQAFTGTYEEWLETVRGPEGAPGADGKEIKLEVNEGYIKWQYDGSDTWTNLVALTDLTGADGVDGKSVNFKVEEGYIKWQYIGDETWTNLIDIDILTGTDGINGKEILLQVAEGYIQWQYAGDDIWTNLIDLNTLTGNDGIDGKEVLFQVSAGYIQWRYEGDQAWTNLVELSTLRGSDGIDGKTVIFQVSEGYIQWQYAGDTKWINLVELESLKGLDGKAVSFQVSDGYIKWQYIGDDTWTNLIDLELLKGTDGASAYELYLIKYPTYDKTEDEWIEDLINGRLVEKQTWIVTLDYNDNLETMETVEVEDLSKINQPIEPVQDGYEFKGWYVGDERWSFIGYVVTEDITLEARWEMITYEITYVLNNGNNNINNPTSFTIEDLLNIVDPTKDGAAFLGWYLDEALTLPYNNELILDNFTLYANWTNSKPIIYAENIIVDQFSEIDLYEGVIAVDEEDGDITENIIIIENNLDITKSGVYYVTYSVTDLSGNSVTKTISITVNEADPMSYPLAQYMEGIDLSKLSAEDKAILFAAAERYLLENVYGGVPLYRGASFTIFSERTQLFSPAYNGVMGYGAEFSQFTEDDSNVLMYGSTYGNAGEYTWRSSYFIDPNSLNPWNADDSVTSDFTSLFSGSLYNYFFDSTKTGYEILPELAQSEPQPVNGIIIGDKVYATKWTITLRDDLEWKFHPDIDVSGLPSGYEVLDANDYIWTWRHAMESDWFRARTGGGDFVSQGIKNAAEYLEGSVTWDQVGIKILDDYTIELEYSEEKSMFDVMYSHAGNVLAPINQELYEKLGVNYGMDPTKVASSGIYYLETWAPGQLLVFKKNELHPDSYMYYFTGHQYTWIDDSNQVFQEFLAGKLDSARIPTSELKNYVDDPRVKLAPDATTWRLQINAFGTEANRDAYIENNPGTAVDETYVPEPILMYTEMRQALMYGFDRYHAAVEVTKVYLPAFTLFASTYFIDGESGVSVRSSEAGAAILDDFGGNSYGYFPDVTLELFKEAVAKGIADGYYSVGTANNYTTIELLFTYASSGNTNAQAMVANIEKQYEELLVDDENFVNIDIIVQDVSFPNNYYDYMMTGATDLGLGGISGSLLDAPSFLDVFSDDNRGGFTLNWGIDTTSPLIPVSYHNLEGEIVYERWGFNALFEALNGMTKVVDGVEYFESYNIYFYSNGGTVMEPLSINENSIIAIDNEPIKENYVFSGWYLDENLSEPFNYYVMPSHDLHLYAKWEPLMYTVSFETNGGSSIEQIELQSGDVYPTFDEPTKANNQFVGWFLDSELSIPFEGTGYISEDIILYAKWSEIEYINLYPYNQEACLIGTDDCNNVKLGDSHWSMTYADYRYYFVKDAVRFGSEFYDSNSNGFISASEMNSISWNSLASMIINNTENTLYLETSNQRTDLTSVIHRIYTYFDENGKLMMYENHLSRFIIYNDGTEEDPDWRFATETEIAAYNNATDPLSELPMMRNTHIRVAIEPRDINGYVIEPLKYLTWVNADVDTSIETNPENWSTIIEGDGIFYNGNPNTVVIPSGWKVVSWGTLDRGTANPLTTEFIMNLPYYMLEDSNYQMNSIYNDQPALFQGLENLDMINQTTDIDLYYQTKEEISFINQVSVLWTQMYDQNEQILNDETKLDYMLSIYDNDMLIHEVVYSYDKNLDIYVTNDEESLIANIFEGKTYNLVWTTITPLGVTTSITGNLTVLNSGVSNISDVSSIPEDLFVNIQGVITAEEYFRTFFVQDETGGIALYSTDSVMINLLKESYGLEINVKGYTHTYNGFQQIVPTEIVILDAMALPLPNNIDDEINESDLIAYQSELVELTNLNVNAVVIDSLGNITIELNTLDTLETIVLIWDSRTTLTVDAMNALNSIVVGDVVDIVTVLAWDNGPVLYYTNSTIITK